MEQDHGIAISTSWHGLTETSSDKLTAYSWNRDQPIDPFEASYSAGNPLQEHPTLFARACRFLLSVYRVLRSTGHGSSGKFWTNCMDVQCPESNGEVLGTGMTIVKPQPAKTPQFEVLEKNKNTVPELHDEPWQFKTVDKNSWNPWPQPSPCKPWCFGRALKGAKNSARPSSYPQDTVEPWVQPGHCEKGWIQVEPGQARWRKFRPREEPI